MGNPSTRHNIGGYISPQRGIVPADYVAGTTNGTGIDRTAYSSLTVFVDVGAASGSPTAQSVIVTLQHSADDSTYADATGGALTTISADSTSGQKDFDISGLNQYVRVESVVAFTGGSTPAIDVASCIIFGGADTLPVT